LQLSPSSARRRNERCGAGVPDDDHIVERLGHPRERAIESNEKPSVGSQTDFDLKFTRHNLHLALSNASRFRMDLSYQMLSDIPSLVTNHYKQGNINWPMAIYISLVHIVAAAGFMAAFQSDPKTLLWAFVLWPIR
jgi:hypothetical protein